MRRWHLSRDWTKVRVQTMEISWEESSVLSGVFKDSKETSKETSEARAELARRRAVEDEMREEMSRGRRSCKFL